MLPLSALRLLAGLLLATALVWTSVDVTSVVAKGNKFRGEVWTIDPCTNEEVSGRSKVKQSITVKDGNILVTETFKIKATSGHKARYVGQGTFTDVAPSYDIPIEGTWTGPTTFSSTGVERVFANAANKPTGSDIQSLNNTCTSGT